MISIKETCFSKWVPNGLVLLLLIITDKDTDYARLISRGQLSTKLSTKKHSLNLTDVCFVIFITTLKSDHMTNYIFFIFINKF